MKTAAEIAREAGVLSGYDSDLFKRFAELVRADERERLLQAVEEMRPVQNNTLLQNKPPEFWISNFKKVIEAKGQA